MRTTETGIQVADGVRLSVWIYEADTDQSERRDLVLLHGWLNSGRIWQEFAEEMLLADPRFRLIAPTFRGYGSSDKPASGYTCAQFATDALFVIGAMNLTDYSLIGHSMGGKIAQVVAMRHPDGLKTLVLLAPAPAGASGTPPERRTAQKALYGNPEATRRMTGEMAAHPIAPEQMDPLMEDALRISEAAFSGWIDAMREEDLSGTLGDITSPTLVILGTKDPLRTEEMTRQTVVDRIPNAALSLLPNVGHLLVIEDPTAVALTVVNFLDHSRPAEVV
jgi:pimeloyl-ACP methyl ester carboxylesterase